ncbi:LADA_0D11188g1_1 [Lachancea dasiensis]|uniref:LADA_0D11188g1_1 n=1 Tax=Lachancea dasiensis TaxID=1072105 RepID=A0A1G4J807_9SACH|nr:LADA_0D11188g1_1 [Lachancea dasiensis]
MERHEGSRNLYNARLQDAYSHLLSERNEDNSLHLGVPESEVSSDEFSDEVSEDFSRGFVDRSERSSNGRSELDDDYEQFKTSLMRDEWAGLDDGDDGDDDDDKDYTEEADRSFLVETDEETDGETSGVNAWDPSSDTLQTNTPKIRNLKTWAIVLMVLVLGFLWRNDNTFISDSQSAVVGRPSSGSSNAQLRAQLNSLYHEMQDDRKTAKKELENAIRLVILQVEKNLKKVLPKDQRSVQAQIDQLESKVQDLSRTFNLNNVTEWQESLISELHDLLPEQIPVVLNNSTRALMVIPELHQYLAHLIPQVVDKTVSQEAVKPFHYDAGQYVREILRDEYQYVDKAFFLDELELALRSSKEDILREMESRISTLENVPQQYSNVLQHKLIHRIYNANQHQWQDDVDFATAAQGTRLLKHLCSGTFQGQAGIPANGVSPLDLLADGQPGSSTYWLCSDKNPNECSWAVRFAQPLYLTRLSYVHGRFTNNLHLMNSAPNSISVYVKLQSSANSEFRRNAMQNGYGTTWSSDASFIEIGTWNYDNSDPRIRQSFPLPPWFIQCKPQVRSVALVVRSNYGNAHYTALRKFVINAVTMQDLQLSSSYVQQRHFEIPEYSSPLEDAEKLRASQVAAWQQGSNEFNEAFAKSPGVISFGQDEFDEFGESGA